MKRLLLILVASLLVLGPLATSAAADDPDIQLSRDGVTWSSNIDEPLFDPDMRWVPGDSETASFYVRNNGGSLGDLTIDVNAGRAGQLIDSGDLRITAMGGGGQWQTVNDGGQHRLLTALDIADGKVAKISLKVTFDADSINFTQLDLSPLGFVVTLSRAASLATAAPADDPADGGGRPPVSGISPSGLLPDTGAPAMAWMLVLAAVLIGSGAALLSERRKGRGDV